MRPRYAFQKWLVIAIVVSLTSVCSQVAAATNTDPLDEVAILGGASKDSLIAIDATARETDTELAAIQTRLQTQLDNLVLSTAKATELLNNLKDTREDRRAERFQRILALLAAEVKIKADNEGIDQQLREAKEKAELAMQQAQTALVIGIVVGLIQTSSAASALSQGDTAGFTSLLQKQLFNVNFQVLEIRKDIGITVRIRVGPITSCLSSKQQCSGLSFTNTK